MFAFCSLDADDLAIKHHVRRGEGHTHTTHYTYCGGGRHESSGFPLPPPPKSGGTSRTRDRVGADDGTLPAGKIPAAVFLHARVVLLVHVSREWCGMRGRQLVLGRAAQPTVGVAGRFATVSALDADKAR